MPTRAARRTRALVLGATLLLLTLLGHDAGGGHAGSLVGIGLAAVVACAMAGAVSGRRLPLGVLFIGLSLGQVLLHLVLSVGAHGAGLSGAMAIGHLAAAAVAAVVIDRGEVLAARWLSYLASTLGAPAIVSPRPAPVVAGRPTADPMRTDPLLHRVTRRGPPLLVAVLT